MPEYINRPPRIQPELPSGEIELPAPPIRESQGAQSLLQVAIPLITIMGYILVSGGRGGGNILFVLPMALSVIATATIGVLGYLRTLRIDKEKQAMYAQRLIELRRDMVASHDKQRAFYMHNFPDIDAILRMVGSERGGPPDSRIWERRPDDNDFGAVRLGIGSSPSTVLYLPPQGEGSDAPQLPDALKLAEDSTIVHDIAITIPLRPRIAQDTVGTNKADPVELGQKIPATGRYAIGVCGPDRKAVGNFVRAMLTNFTAFHSPNDARLYVVGSADCKPDWEWARWLPHCNTSRNEAGRGDLLAFEPRKVRRIWDELQSDLERRQLRSSEESAGDVTLPFLVVVVDATSTTAQDTPIGAVSTEAAVSILMTQGPFLGAAVIFMVPERDLVPSQCRAIIEGEAVEGKLSFRYAEIGLNTLRYDGVADTIDQKRADQEYARKLAPLAVRTTYGADLANAVSLMELFTIQEKEKNAAAPAYQKVDDFPLLEWWRHTRKSESSEWLQAPIGLMGGNKVRSLIFAADGDGVHGMIAGTTGSGKSELLLTLIVGMAMRYDPSVVNFVLADYKGGAAFDPFRPLPHAVDIVTSLQGLAGARTFTATKAEMNRRSAILAETKTKHIVDYRKRNMHVTREPFPFLFIIVDEFAEMVKENPEFKGNLDSITRLGRALGVSLILATQRPAGVVTDQMRANIKWRVCLRVETAEDSRELLKRSDAAFLPNNIPGRAYLQVGNENVELMQVARAGGPYTGPTVEAEPPVIWLSRGTSALEMRREKAPSDEAQAFSDVMVEIMRRVADENEDVTPQSKPWPDPLPVLLTLDQEQLPNAVEPNPLLPLNSAIIDWMEGEGGWHGIDWTERAMRATVGLVDNPINAEQLPLVVDLTKGHAVVFGASGWGKTVFLRTLITALASTHSPKELNVYIMDFGGKGLDVVSDLPHVAAVIMPSEDDRVQGLLRRMADELEQRKVILSQARVDNLTQYNASHPDSIVPALLVVCDNFAEFRESYEQYIPDLISIARDGRANGIHLAITAQTLNTVPGKLYNQLTERMTFRLADPTEYGGVVGRAMMALPEIPGRGYVQMENAALEMQVALAVGVTHEDEQRGVDHTKKLAELVNIMRTTWGDSARPQSIDLVTQLSLSELFSLMDKANYDSVLKYPIMDWWRVSRQPDKSEWLRAPIGLVTGNKVRALLFAADGDGSHGMIAGTTGSGKSELLLTIVAGMAMRYDPSVVNFILADYKGGTAFDPFKGLPHAVDIITNLQGTAGARTFTAMRAEMNRRSVMLSETSTKHIIHYRSRDLHNKHKPFPFLFVIVDEFAEMVKENPEFRGSLDSITRLGRALGVSLILATQRPAGVVNDQMRANMKWRICLRVETAEDSRELLKRPDASYLPNNIPGRGYLQVGNENVELMQVARAGGPYLGPLPDYLREQGDDATRSAVEAPALSDVLTNIMAHMAAEHPDEIATQIKPYPDPLPVTLTLYQDRLVNQVGDNPLLPLNPSMVEWVNGEGQWRGVNWKETAMRANIGLIDNPILASQMSLELNLMRGHAVVFGTSGYGKTSFLRTAVMALAATHSPLELNVYMLDFGGRGLDVLTDLPHVGASITALEEERVLRLLRKLQNEMEVRRTLVSQARVDGIPAYNATHPENIQPAILVLIDNFAEFKESYEALMPDLISIARDARANGIYLIVTAEQTSSVPGKLYSLFTERMTFKLPDATEYSAIVGRGTSDLPPISGRGYVQVDRAPLEMHVALPEKANAEEMAHGLDDTKKLGQLVMTMAEAWGDRPRPQRIEILQTIIPLNTVLPDKAPSKIITFLGIEDRNLEPLAIDLQMRGPHFLLIGPPLSGKTTAMRSWVLALARLYRPDQVGLVLVDFQQRFFKYGGKRSLADLPHVMAAVNEGPQLNDVIEKLKVEYMVPQRDFDKYPRPEFFVLIDNYDDWSSVIGASTSTKSSAYRDLGELSRKYGPEGFHAVVCGSLNIMRGLDEFTRQVSAGRYGLGLDAVDAPSALGGRVRAGSAEFPPGRGYIVKSGRASMVQVATPQGTEEMEVALDSWVDEICAIYKDAPRAQWLADLMPKPEGLPEGEAQPEAQPAGAAATATQGAKAAPALPGAEDPSIAELRAMIAAAKEEEAKAAEEEDPLAALMAKAQEFENKPFNLATPVSADNAPEDGDGTGNGTDGGKGTSGNGAEQPAKKKTKTE